MSERNEVFDANRRAREGVDPVRRLDCGETTFRIPEADFFALRKLFPALASSDGKERFEAWKRFRESPFAERYLVVRTPQQVRRDQRRGVIVR